MKKFLTFTFASCLGVFLAFLIFGFISVLLVGGAMSSVNKQETVKISPNTVLKLDFSQPVPEKTNNISSQNFSLSQQEILGIKDIIYSIEQAKDDNKIKGIYLNISQSTLGKSGMSEIRDAIIDFKDSGKFVVAYSDYYSNDSYYLASAADEVVLNPNGIVEFMGYGAAIPFFKEGLDKLGVKMQVYYAGQFKSATEPFRLDKMSEQNKFQVRSYLSDLYINYLNDISESRALSTSRLKSIANNFESKSAQDAVNLSLVDEIGYEDEAIASLKDRSGMAVDDKLNLVSLPYYFKSLRTSTDFSVKEKSCTYVYGRGNY